MGASGASGATAPAKLVVCGRLCSPLAVVTLPCPVGFLRRLTLRKTLCLRGLVDDAFVLAADDGLGVVVLVVVVVVFVETEVVVVVVGALVVVVAFAGLTFFFKTFL